MPDANDWRKGHSSRIDVIQTKRVSNPDKTWMLNRIRQGLRNLKLLGAI